MKEKVIEIFKKHCAIEEEVTMESELKLLSIDSLTFISILVEIEEEFNIEFEMEELEILVDVTVGDIVDSLEEKVNGTKQDRRG